MSLSVPDDSRELSAVIQEIATQHRIEAEARLRAATRLLAIFLPLAVSITVLAACGLTAPAFALADYPPVAVVTFALALHGLFAAAIHSILTGLRHGSPHRIVVGGAAVCVCLTGFLYVAWIRTVGEIERGDDVLQAWAYSLLWVGLELLVPLFVGSELCEATGEFGASFDDRRFARAFERSLHAAGYRAEAVWHNTMLQLQDAIVGHDRRLAGSTNSLPQRNRLHDRLTALQSLYPGPFQATGGYFVTGPFGLPHPLGESEPVPAY